jgi:hypothetical protein
MLTYQPTHPHPPGIKTSTRAEASSASRKRWGQLAKR